MERHTDERTKQNQLFSFNFLDCIFRQVRNKILLRTVDVKCSESKLPPSIRNILKNMIRRRESYKAAYTTYSIKRGRGVLYMYRSVTYADYDSKP